MADNFLTILEREKPSIQAMLPESIGPDRWWALMVEVAKSRDLQRIAQNNPNSLISAVKKIADWGIDLDGEEAIIIPYGEEAVPQAMYRGLIRRAIEAGAIAHAVADIIKEGDDVHIDSGTDGRVLRHRPAFNLKGGKRPIVGAYAVFTLPNGSTDFELMDSDDLVKVKAAAERMAKRRKPDAGLSPAWLQFEGEMCKKSVLRRGLKRFRGRRDTDAGRRFAEATVATRFDAETSAEELPPDDLPSGENPNVKEEERKPGVGGAVSPPAGRTAKPALKLTADPVVEDRTLNDDEQADLLKQAKAKGLKMADIATILDELGAKDVCELRVSQIEAFEEAIG